MLLVLGLLFRRCNNTLLCVTWLDMKYCRWNCATTHNALNSFLLRECCKTSFICCFIVTAKNLIWPSFKKKFFFPVHGEQLGNDIYLQHWCAYKSAIKSEIILQLAKQLHKPIIRKFEK